MYQHPKELFGNKFLELLSVLKLPLPLGEVGRGSGRERVLSVPGRL